MIVVNNKKMMEHGFCKRTKKTASENTVSNT